MAKRWQFALRSSFHITTLLAVVIALVANLPRVAIVCLFIAGPILIVRATPAFLNRAPRLARWIMGLSGAMFSFACTLLFLHTFHDDKLDWRMWVGLTVLSGFALLCFGVAWAFPGKVLPGTKVSAIVPASKPNTSAE